MVQMPYECHVNNMSEFFVYESAVADFYMDYEVTMEASASDYIAAVRQQSKLLDYILKVIETLINTVSTWIGKFTSFIRSQINKIRSSTIKSNRIITAEIKYWENRRNQLDKRLRQGTVLSEEERVKIRSEIEDIGMRIDKLKEQFKANNKGVLVTAKHWELLNEGTIQTDSAMNTVTTSYNTFKGYLDEYDDLVRGFNRVAYNANSDMAYKKGERDPGVFGYIGATAAVGAAQAAQQTLGKYQYKGRRDVAPDDDNRVAFNARIDEIKEDLFSNDGSSHMLYMRAVDSAKENIRGIHEELANEHPSFIGGKYISDSFINTLQKTVNDADAMVKKVKNSLNYYKEVVKARKLYLSRADATNGVEYEPPRGLDRLTFVKAPEYIAKVIQIHSQYFTYFSEVYNLKADLSLTVTSLQEKR